MKKFKLILKIFGFCLLGAVGLVGVSAVGAWITGAFNPQQIAITSLTIAEPEVLLVGDTDYTTTVSYLPADANQLSLSVAVKSGREVIQNIPSVVAGSPFTIKFAKDDAGHVVGGKLHLQFTNSNGLVISDLKIFVDCELNDDMITFGNNDITTISTGINSGKYVLPAAPNSQGDLYLKSSYNNALFTKRGFVEFSNQNINNLNFKKVYAYTNNAEAFTLNTNAVTSELNGNYTFKFTPKEASSDITIKTFVHRTFLSQLSFEDSWFQNIIAGRYNLIDLTAYNAFLNTYANYFTRNLSGELFFRQFRNSDGLINITSETANFGNALLKSLDFVFIVNEIQFVVSDIEISDIAMVNTDALSLNIFLKDNDKVFDTTSIGVNAIDHNDENYLSVSLSAASGSNDDNETLLNSLKDLVVAPYVEYTLDGNENTAGHPRTPDWTWQKDESDNVIIETGPQIVEGDNTYFMFIKVGEKWYQYNDEYVKITKFKDNGTKWKVETLFPTDAQEVYVGVYIESINELGISSYKYALRQVNVTYTNTTIAFTSNNTTIALNSETDFKAEDRLDYGMHYVNLNMGLSSITIPNYASMEYKSLKWYVPESANIIDKGEGKKYKVVDVVKVVDSTTNELVDSEPVYLYDMQKNPLGMRSDNSFGTDNNERDRFYLVGEGENFTINALNVGLNLPLVCVIAQTDINGEIISYTPHVEVGGEEEPTGYKVVSYSGIHSLSVTNYLNKLYMYYKDGDNFVNCTASQDAPFVIENGQSNTLYVSNMLLDITGTPIASADPNTNYVDNCLWALNYYINTACSGSVPWEISVDEYDNAITTPATQPYIANSNYITINIAACSDITTLFDPPELVENGENSEIRFDFKVLTYKQASLYVCCVNTNTGLVNIKITHTVSDGGGEEG